MSSITPLALVFLLGACHLSAPVGHSRNTSGDGSLEIDSDDQVGDNPGTGSGTLRVEAQVNASSTVDNATLPGQFTTTFSVHLEISNGTLPAAVVEIGSSGGGVVRLTENSSGEYSAAQNGYFRTYSLNITAGSNTVRNVAQVGPAIHTFGAPKEGGSYRSAQDLTVTWTPNGSDEASIESNRFSRSDIPDNGTFTIEGSNFEVDNGKTGGDRIRLRRANRLVPAGAAAGSSFEIQVRNQVEFSVVGR